MKASSFFINTLIAAAAMTSTAWAAEDLTVNAGDMDSTIYVNSAWSGEQEGEIVGDGLIYGSNAFAAATGAFSSGAAEIIVESDINELLLADYEFIINKDTTISSSVDGEARLVNFYNNGTGYDIVIGGDHSNSVREKLTIDKNVTLKVADRLIWIGYHGNDVDVVVDGTLSGYQLWVGADTTVSATGKLVSASEAFVLRRGAVVTLNGNAAQGAAAADRTASLEASYTSLLAGKIIANDTLIESGKIGADNSRYAGEGSIHVKLDNTIWNSTGNLQLGSGVLFEVNNGSILNVTLHDGYEASSIGATSSLRVDGGTVNASTMNVSGEIDVYNGKLNIASGKTLTINEGGKVFVRGASDVKAGNATNNGTINVDGSTFAAGSVANEGTFNVTGESTVKFDKLTMAGNTNFVGQSSDVAGTHKVTLGSYTTGEAAEFATSSSDGVYFYGANVTLNSDVAVNIGKSKYFYFKNSTLDLKDNTLDVNLAKFLTTNLNVTGTGNIVIGGDVTTDMPCWRGNENVIGKDVTITSYEQQNIYGNLTVYGTVKTYNGTNNNGGNGVDLVGVVASGFEYSHDAVLTISGAKASYTIYGGPGFEVTTATNGLIVEDGASFDMRSGTFTNKGTVEVNGATFKATSVVNNSLFSVSGSSQLVIDSFNYSDVTVAAGSTLTDSTVGGEGCVYMLGDLTLKGTNDFYYLWGDKGGTLTIEDGTTQKFSNIAFGDTPNADAEYVFDGGAIDMGSGFLQHGKYTLNSDINSNYIYLSYGGTFTVNGSITGNYTPKQADAAIWVNGEVSVNNGGSLNASQGNILLNDSAAKLLVQAGATVTAAGTIGDGRDSSIGSTIEVAGEVIADRMTNNGTLTVLEDGKVTLSGALTNEDTGTITIDALGNLTANEITGNGDVVLAGTIKVVKGLSADVLTIHAGATLIKEGVDLRTAVVDSVIFAKEIVLVVDKSNDLQDGTLDLDTIFASVEGLSDAIQSAEDGVYIKDSKTGVTYSTTFDSVNGKIMIVVPEPSAFGLLAGLGALALVAARRRRK